MPRSRPWSASRSSWRSRGSGRSLASAAIAIAKAYAVALTYIAAVACVVTTPGLLMAGAAGAVAAAGAEVAAYSAAVAYVVAEKGGLRPPFRMLGCACCQKVRECVLVPVGTLAERADLCNECMCVGVCCVSALRDAPVWRRMGPDRRLLARTRAFFGSKRAGPWPKRACWMKSGRRLKRACRDTTAHQCNVYPVISGHRCTSVTGMRSTGWGEPKQA